MSERERARERMRRKRAALSDSEREAWKAERRAAYAGRVNASGATYRPHGERRPAVERAVSACASSGRLTSGDPLYNVWRAMIGRCYEPGYRGYGPIGGRGVVVCEEWRADGAAFAAWALANGWKHGLRLARRDSAGPYSPENCWLARRGDPRRQSAVYAGKLRDHRLYRNVYLSMVRRCHDERDKSWGRYGGRGIVVCDAWRGDPRAFVDWAITHGWQVGLQLDRRDNDGPYAPENCRFVTPAVNMANRGGTRAVANRRGPLRLSAVERELVLALRAMRAAKRMLRPSRAPQASVASRQGEAKGASDGK